MTKTIFSVLVGIGLSVPIVASAQDQRLADYQ
jgi:hypothetical protein